MRRSIPHVWRRRLSCLAVACLAALPATLAAAPTASAGPFTGRGMWIWEINHSAGGSVSAIIAKAHRYRFHMITFKASDGNHMFSPTGGSPQFTRSLVRRLHRANIQVCGYQYVYPNGHWRYGPANVRTEARLAGKIKRLGADCIMIDAESEWEGGHYADADAYIRGLRRHVGASFPVGLAGFPYVDFHPSYPYSVFLGRGGAQANVPQIYWKAIGDSVRNAWRHTFVNNRVYKRKLAPIGQLYSSPSFPRTSEILEFRRLAINYHAAGVSWWDWQSSTEAGFRAVRRSVSRVPGFRPTGAFPNLKRGASSDIVIVAQERLVGSGIHTSIDGSYGSSTATAVRKFQRRHNLHVDGKVGRKTWRALLRQPLARKRWTRGRAAMAAAASGRPVGGPSPSEPISAFQPSRGNEIPPHGH